MPIKHGTTSISAITYKAGILTTSVAHAYHNVKWVFDERCVKFYSYSSFTIKLGNSNDGKSWNGTIQYANNSAWADYTAGTTLTSKATKYGDSGSTIYEVSFRGIGNTRLATANAAANASTFTITPSISGAAVYCEGDLLYLLDYTASSSYSAATYTFCRLFYNCTALARAPQMSLAALPGYCYHSTFYGCTKLSTVPTPGWTSFSSTYVCYAMFRDCTNLSTITLPKIHSLTNYCYAYMFYGCTGLTECPAFIYSGNSVAFGTYSCSYMFYNCTSLKHARFAIQSSGSAPVTVTLGSGSTLNTGCMQYMFSYCTSLTSTYRITSGGTIYQSLVAMAPTTFKQYCYRYMYRYCSSLRLSTSTATATGGRYRLSYRLPSSGTGTSATNWNTQMFTSISSSSAWSGAPSINTTYYLWEDN